MAAFNLWRRHATTPARKTLWRGIFFAETCTWSVTIRALIGSRRSCVSPQPKKKPRTEATLREHDAQRIGISGLCGEVPKVGPPTERAATEEDTGRYGSIMGNRR